MNKEEFSKLSDFDKIKHCVEESLKEHEKFDTEFWNGSAHMAKNVLMAIEQVKNLTTYDVNKSICPHCNGSGELAGGLVGCHHCDNY